MTDSVSNVKDGMELAGAPIGWAGPNLQRVLQTPYRPTAEELIAAKGALERMAIRFAPKKKQALVPPKPKAKGKGKRK